LALIVFSVLAWAALIWAVAEAAAGRPITVANALGHARALSWGRIVMTVLLVWGLFLAFVTLGGTALAVVIEVIGEWLSGLPSGVALLLGLSFVLLLGGPFLRWVVRLLFLPQVMVLEFRWGISALRRTGDLIRGNWWRALTCWLLFAAIESLPSLILYRWPLAQRIAQFFVAPLGGIWVTLFYQAMASGRARPSYGTAPLRV
jgi:hypothetical protein